MCKKCSRLQSQLATLESLKHGGITQEELCRLVLRILRLVTATVTFEYTPVADGRPTRKATLRYENVGYLYKGDGTEEPYENAKNPQELNDDLEQRFALPEPGREALLSIAVSILSKKGILRGVSNSSLYPEGSSSDGRFLLIIHWQALLRMLLRTTPYLDEHKSSNPPTSSSSRQNTIVRRTVHLIRHARHFFDQGIRPPGCTSPGMDVTSRIIWEMVKDDVLHQTHTHASYRGAILLYLFMPSQCTSDFYLEVMPQWLQSWSSIDRCPDFDYMWLVLFCRARKHVSPEDYDWGPVRRRLLTHSQYWYVVSCVSEGQVACVYNKNGVLTLSLMCIHRLQIPIGGGSMDKSFPRAATPRARSCPARLKSFIGGGGSYEEGMDFVAKVVKLLVVSIGTNELGSSESAPPMSQGTSDILRFLSFIAPYFNPSNIGAWTFSLGAFLHYFSYELTRRVSSTCSLASLENANPALASALCEAEPCMKSVSIPPNELAALLHALLSLCQQALYSKNGYVGRAGEAAMAYLAQIDPIHVAPPFLDFATNALDVSAVNLSHQAPSALSALARLVQPSLRRKPSILLRRLPQILQLSLAGIDSNDQNKCIRTLIFYRGLTSWIPVVAEAKNWPKANVTRMDSAESGDGTLRVGVNTTKQLAMISNSSEYLAALEGLPETSLLRQYDSFADDDEGLSDLLLEETAAAMGDWVLAFLDRVFDLLRHTGEREKTGKTGSGVANRHSSSDVQQARNFSRVLKESLGQIFASMDDSTHKMAVRTVVQFLDEESLPSAAKDASAMCQAVAASRFVDGECVSPGLDALLPVLVQNLDSNSSKTTIYRLRCLAGAVRGAGQGVVKHRDEISRAIDFALSSDDKDVFKTGCKLLRHALASLCESYPLSSECSPRLELEGNVEEQFAVGKSASLRGNSIHWHVPNKEEIEFACDLIQDHVMQRIDRVCRAYADEGFLSKPEDDDASIVMVDSNVSDSKSVDAMLLRQCLRVLRYSLRGCVGLLLDRHDVASSCSLEGISPVPHEQAVQRLLSSVSDDATVSLLRMRGTMCSFLVSLSSAIASETAQMSSEVTPKNGSSQSSGLISSDTKVCKELSTIMTMLLTRRSAPFRSQECTSIWKAQKQNVTDVLVLNTADEQAAALQRASQYGDGVNIPYKDGEDGGKTMTRRLLVARLQIFHESIERNASFEIPRRLRRLEGHTTESSNKLFDAQLDMSTSLQQFVQIAKSSPPSALRLYESLLDGLFVLCCHPNTQVRSSAIGVIDYAFTRFGWVVRSRIPRLLTAISLDDVETKGNYGIPSCSQLSAQTDSQGKRKRLAEVLKGVCSILAAPRVIRDIMWSETSRFEYVKTICSTDKLISILPVEEMQKMIQYFQTIFSPFRSKVFCLPRVTEKDQRVHEECLVFLLDILSDDAGGGAIKEGTSEDDELLKASGENHWRKRLLVGWFICNFIDESDTNLVDIEIRHRMWRVCFDLLEKEMGQPLQRVAVGLLGLLVSFVPPFDGEADDLVEKTWLREMLEKESFCRSFGQALVFDHRADTSIGGGHGAQWSAGVEDILRDSARFVAPRTVFPFKRTSQNSGTFKMPHAQLIENVLCITGPLDAPKAARHLLAFATEMAEAPPSEDQRNQQCTSAEIFAGVCRALMKLTPTQDQAAVWETALIPFLENVMPKLPISVAGSFFDAIRYGIQSLSPSAILPLVSWMVANIESSLWKPTETDALETPEAAENDASSGADGFANQSKYMYLATAVIIELGEESDAGSHLPWFVAYLQDSPTPDSISSPAALNDAESWVLIRDQLLPRLVDSVGHPYETCRDHIAGCLFRIWRCNEWFASQQAIEGDDPTTLITQKLTSLDADPDISFKERYNSLITARKFISYCTHLGDAQKEFSRLVIPLLPVAFEAVGATVDLGSNADEDNAAKRSLEAEVVKGFRYTIAEVSSSSVMSYPGEEKDISRVLAVVEEASKHEFWQVRHTAAHFLRCFQGSHKFLFSDEHSETMTRIVSSLLSDERREVSSASMSALTGILAATPQDRVSTLVTKYVSIANRSRQRRKKNATSSLQSQSEEEVNKEKKRSRNQQTSVFFLCAAVLAQPYETPPYVPVALAAISKHSFERSAPLGVRDTVKKCCGEYKRTHMSDNWEIHRKAFSQEQLEALEDVVSSPHYYA